MSGNGREEAGSTMDYPQSYWTVHVDRVNAASLALPSGRGSGGAESTSRSPRVRIQAPICWKDARNRHVALLFSRHPSDLSITTSRWARTTVAAQAAFPISYPGEQWKRFLRLRSGARAGCG
jgi:hypothetical protein